MERRAFVHALAAAASLASLPGLARGAGTAPLRPAGGAGLAPAPAPTGDAIAAFDAAAARWPWLAATKGTPVDLDCAALAIEGRWPRALAGRFYRNGPALFERGGQRQQHWFDGDGMVQQYAIADGRVAHRGRFVHTAKFRDEQAAGGFRLPGFGRAGADGVAVDGPDALNVANTNAIEHAGRVLALWEGGSAYALDAATLATAGPVTWLDGWKQMPFSAHPKVDPQGRLWNFGSSGERVVTYEIGADGRLGRAQVGRFGVPAGMVHDMAVTDRHFVVPLPPVGIDVAALTRGEPETNAFPWNPAEPLRIWVADKADIANSRVFELPSAIVFHVGNAWEREDGTIVLSYVGQSDNDFLQVEARDLIRGSLRARGGANTRAWVAELDPRTGRATQAPLLDACEFPRVHPGRIGLRARQLLAPVGWREFPGRPRYWFHGIALADVETGRVQRHDYGRDAIAEEHVLVPKPGGRDELDAWVLGTHFDAARRVTRLAVFEARALADGPIAVASLPYATPLGFHGNFAAA